MEIITLMRIAVIMILLSSFPAPIKVAGRRRGGGSIGRGIGFRGGNVGTGNSGKAKNNMPTRARPGEAYMVTPQNSTQNPAKVMPTPQDPAKVMPTPQECKHEVRECINTHIYGNAGAPKHNWPCCNKIKHSVRCLCKFLTSRDPKLSKNTNDLLRGCRYRKPKCPKMPMPQACRHEVRHCVNTHIYGGAGEPQHGGACCNEFKNSQRCVCTFLASADSHLSKNANGVVRGCRFGKPNCTKI